MSSIRPDAWPPGGPHRVHDAVADAVLDNYPGALDES